MDPTSPQSQGIDPAEPKPRLVVADDQMELLAMMHDVLEMNGYEVRTAANGQEALDLVRQDPPDVVILDLWMPIKDGFAVCRELKEHPLFQHLPIILLSAASDRDNKIQGMELGADDFVTKPVDLMELLARIRMIIRRNRQGLDANPLTKLPGNVSIQKRIAAAIASKKPLAVLYTDLNSFKAYNDCYGYDKGDRVIRATAELLLDAVKRAGDEQGFVGHIGGDDFIVVTTPDRMETLSKDITGSFDALVPSFYTEEDRKRGKILSKDRRGEPVEYPLLSIAIGVCHNTLKPLTSYAQVSSIGAELKTHAKRQEGSAYSIDRRRE
ncbi:MAG: response regulator [Elusimicrobiota bacterium]